MKKWFTLLAVTTLVISLGFNVYFIKPYIANAGLYQCDDSQFVAYRPVYYILNNKVDKGLCDLKIICLLDEPC